VVEPAGEVDSVADETDEEGDGVWCPAEYVAAADHQ